MRVALLACLGVMLLAASAGAGGGMPQTWRWFADTDAAGPAAITLQNQTLWGASPHRVYRLRTGYDFSGRLGNWNTGVTLLVRPAGTQLDFSGLGPGASFLWADGAGTHGAPVESMLLTAAEMPGIFVESHPPGTFAGYVTGMVECDFSLSLNPVRFRPQMRYEFATAITTAQGATGVPVNTNNHPDACTRGGQPRLTSAQTLRWKIFSRESPGILTDMDGDGERDLVTTGAHWNRYVIRFWKGLGDLEFAVGETLQGASGPLQLPDSMSGAFCAVDWDEDLDQDLYVFGNNDRITYLLRNQGDGTFDETPLVFPGLQGFTGFSWCEFVDWDADGDPDFLAGAYNPGKSWNTWLGVNIGSYDTPLFEDALPLTDILAQAIGPGSGGAIVDYDGDGLRDLVLSGMNQLLVYYNAGDSQVPVLQEQAIIELPVASVDDQHSGVPYLLDLDGDGDLDLILSGEEGGPAFWTNQGTLPPVFDAPPGYARGAPLGLSAPVHAASFAYPNYLTYYRLDPQLVAGDASGRVYILLNSGGTPPSFSDRVPAWLEDMTPIQVDPPSAPLALDWGQDGLIDLIVGTGSGELLLFVNTNTNYQLLFAAGVPLPNGGEVPSVSGPARPALGDLDSDGLYDLAVGAGDGSISWFANRGSAYQPLFDPGVEVARLPAGPVSPAVVDWDEDGLVDLLAGTPDGTVSFLKNLGTPADPVFDQPVVLESADGPIQLGGECGPAVIDWDMADCARDLLVFAGDGTLLLYSGEHSARPAVEPLFPLDAAFLDQAGTDFIANPPELSWQPADNPDGGAFWYVLELSDRSDFTDPVRHLSEEGSAPSASFQLPEPFGENRRTFWRVRMENQRGNLGEWSRVESFVTPPPETVPVTTSPQAGPAGTPRRGEPAGGDYRSVRAGDGHLALPSSDTLESVQEVLVGSGYRLLWFYRIDPGPLADRRHVELVVRAQVAGPDASPADEPVYFELHAREGWRRLGQIGSILEESRFPLDYEELRDDSVVLRFVDQGLDSTASELSVDWLALVDFNQGPLADAGEQRETPPGQLVILDGSQSSDPDGDPLAFSWVQLSGPGVDLVDADTATPSLHSPEVEQTEVLVFELTVSDGYLYSSATTSVTVVPRESLPVCALRVTAGAQMPSTRSYPPGTDGVAAMQLRLDSAGRNPVRLSGLTINLNTRGFADTVRGAAITLDLDGDGASQPSEPVLGRLLGNNAGPLDFTALGLDIPAGETRNVLLLLDLPNSDPVTAAAFGTAGVEPLLPAILVFLALGLAFGGRRRRLLAAVVLVIGLAACIREGYNPWASYVRAGLLSNQAVQASSPDGSIPATVAGPPVIGNWQVATSEVVRR